MKCACYARFSSDKQKAVSIEDQVRRCRSFADSRGWKWQSEHVYSDEAISGTTSERAGLAALLSAAAGNGVQPFDCILVDDTSRISRNLADTLRFYERLSFAGVRIVAVSQGVDSTSEQAELMMGVHGLIDSVYSRELAKKTHRGMEGIALRGLATGGRCFGYRSVSKDGKTQLEVYEPEAAIVRRIFEMSSQGTGVTRISRILNAEKLPSPQPYRGQRHPSWAPAAVSVMLRNERYAGRLIWNQTRKIRNPETGRRIQRPRPRSEWIVTPAEQLRVVGEDLFAAVQERLKRMREACADGAGRLAGGSSAGASGRAAGYLLSGLLKCGLCGSRMVIVAGRAGRALSNRYGCPLHHRGVCSNTLSIWRHRVEDAILSGIESRILSPTRLRKYAQDFEDAVRRRMAAPASNNDVRHADLDRKAARLARLVAENESSEHLLAELKRIEGELASLRVQAARPKLPASADVRRWFMQRMMIVRKDLQSESAKTKAILATHVPDGIQVVPEASGYLLSLKWNVSLHGAGGPEQMQSDGMTVECSWTVAA